MQDIARAFPGWEAVDVIGKGSFGIVYGAKAAGGGESAVKVLTIPKDEDEVYELKQMGYDALSIRSQFRQRADAVMAEVRAMQELVDCRHVVDVEDCRLQQQVGEVGWEVYNEISACHGYIFNNDDLRSYFGSKSWYDSRHTSDEFISVGRGFSIPLGRPTLATSWP